MGELLGGPLPTFVDSLRDLLSEYDTRSVDLKQFKHLEDLLTE